MSSTTEPLGRCGNWKHGGGHNHDVGRPEVHPQHETCGGTWQPIPDARTEVDEAKCVWSGQSPAPAVWAGRKGDRVTCECGASVALCARRLNWSRAQDTYLKDHAAAPYTPGTPEPEGRWVCGGCGLPMSRNPHPDAGNPTLDGSQVGYVWECIPCLVQTRNRVGRSWRDTHTDLVAARSEIAEVTVGKEAAYALVEAASVTDDENALFNAGYDRGCKDTDIALRSAEARIDDLKEENRRLRRVTEPEEVAGALRAELLAARVVVETAREVPMYRDAPADVPIRRMFAAIADLDAITERTLP